MKDTKIEWAHHTFNPWEGCTKVSPGCANCYAEARNSRFNKGEAINWGKGAPRRRTSAANWKQPLQWNAEEERAEELYGPRLPHIPRPRIFCASLADWLDPEVPIEWLADLLDLIRQTPNLDWLLLTKRPELWAERMQAVYDYLDDSPILSDSPWFWVNDWLSDKQRQVPANVWIGTTVEDQARADKRIPELLAIPAKVRFLSCEPLLGPLDLVCMLSGDALHNDNGRWIDWIICGGESGPKARPMHPDWARSLRDQCAYVHHSVPFLFKQWGEWLPGCQYQKDSAFKEKAQHTFDGENTSFWVGKHDAGRKLDGVTHNAIPQP